MNWARHFRYRPREFVRPTTEAEIVELVRHSRRVRVFGSGHSFNSGLVSDDTLVSLNDYSGLVWKGPDKKQIAVKGGTRVRDVVELLFRRRARLRRVAVPRCSEHRGHPLHRCARDRGELGFRQPVGRSSQADRRQRRDPRMRAVRRPLQGGDRGDRRRGI